MDITPSKWRRFRKEFSFWAEQRKGGPVGAEATGRPMFPLAPQEQKEFKELIEAYQSQDPLLDWAAREVESAMSQLPLFSEGQVLAGRFEIVRFLGRGGMGEVYEATNTTLQGSRVALKTLNAEVRQRPDATRRFVREVELAQRVTHPNICRIHDIFPFVLTEGNGNEVQGHFLTMQLLHGESLAQYIADRGTIPQGEALPILRTLADALEAAHAEHVVHRDFKPGNIILVRRSEVLQPVITDFGLAALVDRSVESDSDSFGAYTRAGTPDYAAPEQLSGGRSGPASDIYSLGVVALEMLTGSTARAGLQALPPNQRRAISRCLHFDPEARFATAPDFVAALAGQAPRAGAAKPGINRRVAIGGASAVVVGCAFAYYEGLRGTSRNLNTLSILPFELTSPNTPLPGFQDELVRAFLRSRKVKLIAPYSTSSLGAPFHVEQLAKLLPADGFLMGAISEAAVVVRLFHRSGSRLWEQTFPRVGGSFELHQKVITATLDEIAGAAEARVVSSGNYVPSEEGYRAYIAARSAVKGQTDNNLLQAEALFVEAIRHDGGFAHAFSGLGYVLFLMGGARIADARTAISRALALDPDHAEAHMVKSLILHNCDWQWPEALIEIKKALDAEPYNFAVHQVYGGFLCDQGLLEEGLPEIQTAVDYDPLSYTAKFSLGIMSTHARRFDFAIEQLEQSIKIAKDAKVEISRPYNYLGACWLMKGDKLKAYQYYQRGLAAQPADPLTLCHYIFGVAKCGHLTEARAKMDQLLRMPGAAEIPFYTGLAFAGLGDLEKALDYLELAVKKRDSTITTVKIHLYCDPLRNKPRFEAILRSMHLA